MAANQRCKLAEETIQGETENMEQLSKMVEEKFSEVRVNNYIVESILHINLS